MRRRYLAILVPLLVAAANQPPPPWAETRGDLDGDGKPETARLNRDGTLIVSSGSDGKELAKLTLPEAARIEKAQIAFVPVENRVVLQARAELGYGHADEVVLAPGGSVIFNGRTGPVGDGDRGERLRVDESGVVRYQTAPGATRCDGNELLFPERWDFASGRFRAVVVEAPPGKLLRA